MIKNTQDKKNTESFERLPGLPESYWIKTASMQRFPALDKDIETDVLIIGAGLVGVTLAYFLKKEGIRFAVVDAGRAGFGTTGHTTAKITSQHSLIYDTLIKKHGLEITQQYASANENAIDIIHSIVLENKIDCDLEKTNAYVYTRDDSYISKIRTETDAALKAGIKASLVEHTDLPLDIRCAMLFENQAQFHPLKYLSALLSKLESGETFVFEQTRVVNIIEGNNPKAVTERGFTIKAQRIVMATHYPFWDRHGLYFSRLAPERSYLMAVCSGKELPRGMHINAETPARTARTHLSNGERILITGGENHKTGHGNDMAEHYEAIRRFAGDNFEVDRIICRWSAQDYTSVDELPYAGPVTADIPNIFLAAGFRKWGMTNSTASARIICDLILHGKSPWFDAYNPSRFTPGASAKNFVVENADVAASLVSGKLGLDRNTGRESPGACSHMGCELRWNSAEHSWDCPCHGSRFTEEGMVIEGPAVRNIDDTKTGM